MKVSEDDIVAWLCEEVSDLLEDGVGMGTIEKLIDRVSLECRRRALEWLVQRASSAQAMVCPHCKQALGMEERHRGRTLNSTFGFVRFERSYGFCSGCGLYAYPADVALGLQERAPASPRVQEMCAIAALRGPAGQVQKDLRRMTGIDLDPSTVHREARRQGDRALVLRDADVALTQTQAGVSELNSRACAPSTPFTMVIEIDAWNIRERDNWGQSEVLREAGKDPGRWHWVYTGTVFRLDQRGTTASGRPIIAERGYVATRSGIGGFQPQLYAEAIQRGLLQAEHVLILADGAVWIWNIADDRFKGASQRVDLYHVKEHLWSLAKELYTNADKAREWVTPFLNWLDRRTDGALDVIQGLEGLRARLDQFTASQQEAIEREIGYFNGHKNRMDYKTGKKLGQPVGSGAIESTCSQYQRRFKLTGQYWSLEGDEAFLALFNLHRNERWNQLFPHDCE